MATDGHRSDEEGRWRDVVQADAYPIVHVGSFAERAAHAHALVKDAGHCSCGDDTGWLFRW